MVLDRVVTCLMRDWLCGFCFCLSWVVFGVGEVCGALCEVFFCLNLGMMWFRGVILCAC